MARRIPPEFLTDILTEIEMTVLLVADEQTKLTEKDIELTYTAFKVFFRKLAADSEVDEPISSKPAKQALIDHLLEHFDRRLDTGVDAPLINNPAYAHGGLTFHCAEALYALAFSYVEESVQFWQKEHRHTPYSGYIDYVRNFLPD